MALIAPTQFYKGLVTINGVPIPFAPGAAMPLPENFDTPGIVGNFYEQNYGQGAVMPVFTGDAIVRDLDGEVLSTAFMSPFLARTGTAAHATTALASNLSHWDGIAGRTMTGCKADSFTLGARFGGPISVGVRYVGSGITNFTSAPTDPAFDASSVLRFNSLSLGGALACAVQDLTLVLSNNHVPEPGLCGSKYPSQMNAGTQTVRLSVTMNAQALADLPADGTPITITITGTAGAATFTINNPRWDNRASINSGGQHVRRTYNITGLGTNVLPPLSYTTTF